MKRLLTSSLILLLTAAAAPSHAWQPTGVLTTVPVVESCWMTGGDIGIMAPGPIIYWCSAVAAQVDAYYPGASLFYYAHEFGHVVQPNGGEPLADCWAAQQLAAWRDYDALWAVIKHFHDRGWEYLPGYGTGFERSQRIRSCAGL